MNKKRIVTVVLAVTLIVVVSTCIYLYNVSFLSSSDTQVLIKTISRTRYIHANGTVVIVSVQVYWDLGCTVVMTQLDWGKVNPGYTYNQTGYVRNEGNVPINVTFCSTNWNPPEADEYIDFRCSTEYDIALNEIRPLNFQLVIDSNIQNITNFSFDIVVVGEG